MEKNCRSNFGLRKTRRKIIDLILILKNMEKNCRSKILRRVSTLDLGILIN